MTPLLFAMIVGASAQEAQPPRRAIPPSVLAELAAVEDRFERAVATDCHAPRGAADAPPRAVCFSRGCTYVAHAVADRPQAASLPGLGGEPGPGSVEPQAWLTQARCSFAHEDFLDPTEVQALAQRLETKVTVGWTVVSVGSAPLPALRAPEPPETVAPEPAPPPPPTPWTRELWTTLLDDVPWMVAVVLGTLAITALIWAWRRVGRISPEERALWAELERGPEVPSDPPEAPPEADAVLEMAESWRRKLDGEPPPEVRGMLRDLLRARELPLLAKAVLTFPETLPRAFPSGGDVAEAKLELAAFLRTVDTAALPSDAELFAALRRHALSAAIATQRDAEIVRSLRESFGAAGLVGLVQRVSPRAGALVFALAPGDAQHEMVRLLPQPLLASLTQMLLRSNRMDPTEAAHLFEVLQAAGRDEPLPVGPSGHEISDHGDPFDAAGALSTLLPRLAPADRAALLTEALDRFGGSLPAWYADILIPDMLLELPDEARADLLLGIEVEPLAAWLSLADEEAREQILARAPGALKTSVRAVGAFPSRTRQVALAERCRRDLARGVQVQLGRTHRTFEQVIRALGDAG